jgi:hypothetical protein
MVANPGRLLKMAAIVYICIKKNFVGGIFSIVFYFLLIFFTNFQV